jgi:hypothetical protein
MQMSFSITHRWMWMAAWLVATAVLWGVSIAKLAEMDYRPMSQTSSAASQLRLKLHQLDQLALKRSHLADGLGVYLKTSAPLPQPPKEIERKVGDAIKVEPSTVPVTPPLPRLSGIIRVAAAPGRNSYSVLIEGRLYSPKDHVSDFLIEDIATDGIRISRRGQRWFIPAPDVYYSLHRSP